MEQKIDVEIRIREGTTKLLAACQHPSQALEAAKTLQTSNERMNAYTKELHSRKHDTSSASPASTRYITERRVYQLCFRPPNKLKRCREIDVSLEIARSSIYSVLQCCCFITNRHVAMKCCSYFDSTARLGLSDLRLPLMWKDTDHFKNRGDYRRFAVFCLAKVGTEVMDTSLVTPVDRSATDITFPDALVL